MSLLTIDSLIEKYSRDYAYSVPNCNKGLSNWSQQVVKHLEYKRVQQVQKHVDGILRIFKA